VRRIVIAVMSTISGLVLLFSYHTSQGQATASAPAGTGSTGASSNDTAAGTTTDATTTDPTTEDGAPTGSSATTGSTGSGSGSGSTGSSTDSSTGSSTGSSTMQDGTYTGDSVSTRWGTVQVRISVQDGKITSAEAIDYPNSNHHDQEINAYAVPVLNEEAVVANSADIDAVSGATVTSHGYVRSLQSAIDQAFQG
jgi:uncharacterized protein with FMN-binding domain